MSSPFQPVFTDGWAPSITEPELIGILNPASELEHEPDEHQIRPHSMGPSGSKRDSRGDFSRTPHYEDSDEYEDNLESRLPGPQHRGELREDFWASGQL